ncbi:prolyl oligopeptidase family serine peptidase [Tenggerimyces flavus]|uniref:prolyl oligopeptidase n=1 Tax=Tenggerimyces flavus TaxID=1708749 RepID=A0ABV7YJK4_9ACTN|nr:prolyl oligopeptidase family serine peptidase [Tenggerimyces flavus]MBM7787615.1 prolyl oligopeptidase [Tenggerimyces flavus]
MRYPEAARQPIVDDLYGHRVPDPYRWLEDPASPETQRWQSAQDTLWREYVEDNLAGQVPMRDRIAELSAVGSITLPSWRGSRAFYLRRDPQQEHAILYVAREDGTETALLDPVALDSSGTITLDHWQPDPTGRYVTVQLSSAGTERGQLYVIDVDAENGIDGPIDRVRYSPIAWLADGSAFYYVRALADLSAWRVWLHRVAKPAEQDVEVFGNGRAETTSYGLGMSADGRWLVVSATAGTSAANDVYLADLHASSPESPIFQAVQENLAGQTVANVAPDGRLYLATTVDAPYGRVCVTDPAKPAPEHWTDLVRAETGSVLADFAVLDGLQRPLLVVATIQHAASSLSLHDLHTGERVGAIRLPGIGTVTGLTTRPSNAHELWFGYADHVTPEAVYVFDARTGTVAPAAATHRGVPNVEAHDVLYPSADGTPVRMVVLTRPDRTGPRPTILYGYGGFGVPMSPSYSSFTLAWVEAGGAFAAVQLRGGSEEGADWHRAGTLAQKQNTFDDFVAAAEHLIADGWTTADQLGACGESNGGLTVGAAITQRPDLFAAAVASAPLLDMARYELTGLGPSWRTEYGTANDPEQVGWLLGYSPYHHVSAQTAYPAVLFNVFASDTRVDPLHARKTCAALQWASTSERPVLIRTERDAGHGAQAVSASVDVAADLLAFLAVNTGLQVGGP